MRRNTLGQTATRLAADGNNNGQIDYGDYIVWRGHFGQSVRAVVPVRVRMPQCPSL